MILNCSTDDWQKWIFASDVISSAKISFKDVHFIIYQLDPLPMVACAPSAWLVANGSMCFIRIRSTIWISLVACYSHWKWVSSVVIVIIRLESIESVYQGEVFRIFFHLLRKFRSVIETVPEGVNFLVLWS